MRPVPLLVLALLAGCSTPGEPVGDAPRPAPVLVFEAPASGAAPDADAPPVPPARVAKVVPLEVQAPGGARLRGHAYLPDRDPPFSAIVGVGPYWGGIFPATDGMADGTGRLRPIYTDTTYDALLAAGFAVALFNVRGTGASDGCYRFFDPADGADAAAIVEAVAGQRWSDGDVGMYGVSYDGWTQYGAMAAGAPHLRATAPVSGIVDVWSVHTRNGAAARPYLGAGAFYTAAVAGAGRSCPAGARAAADVDVAGALGDRTVALAARDLRAGVAASGIPALVTYGLARPQMPEPGGDAAPFEGLIMNARDLRWLPEGSRVLVGQWGHGPPPLASFPDLVVGWFDHHLRGAAAPPVEPARYEDDAGAWHAAASWPPAAQERTLEAPGSRALVSSDRPPTLSACGPDQAVWAFEPVAGEVLLAGSFRLAFDASASAPDGNLAAYLFASAAEEPCGKAARELARAHTDLRHRGQLERGEPFPVLAATRIEVSSAPFAARVGAGERLVLVIAGGDGLELVPKGARPALLLDRVELTLPVIHAGE